MNKQSSQSGQQQIRELLLGGPLPPDRSTSTRDDDDFETRLFADDALYQQVREEQETLIEEYVCGELSSNDERRFRAQCERSSTLRARVDEFRTLRSALERRRTRLAGSHKSRAAWPRLLWPSLATIAAVLLVAIAIRVAGVHRARIAGDAISKTTASASNDRVTASAAPPPTFFLQAGATRGLLGGAATTPVLKITPQTPAIELQLELRGSSDTVTHWQIDLIRDAHPPSKEMPGPALLAATAQPQQLGAETFLVARLPTTTLPDGSYAIRITPLDTDIKQQTQLRPFILKRVASQPE